MADRIQGTRNQGPAGGNRSSRAARPGAGQDRQAERQAVLDRVLRPRDAVSLSRESGAPDRSLGGSLLRGLEAVKDGVNRGARAVGDGLRTAGEFGGVVLTVPAQLGVSAGQAAYRYGGAALGAGLEALGQDELGARLRESGQRNARYLDGFNEELGFTGFQLGGGTGEGLAGLVEGPAALATRPVQSAQGLAQVVRDPGLLAEGYRQVYEERGPAGLVGNLGFDLLGTVVSGGGAAAAAGSRASAGLTRTAAGLNRAGQRLGGPLGDGLQATARGLAQVPELPGRAGARIARGLERLRGTDLPADVAQDVRRLSDSYRGLSKELDGLDEAAGQARIAELVDREYGDLARRLDELSAESLDLPAGYRPRTSGDTPLDNRTDIVGYLRDTPDLAPDQKLRLLRGTLADADPRGPVALVDFREGDQVFRAYSSDAALRGELGLDSAGPGGAYFSPLEDRFKNSSTLRSDSALPGFNRADRGLTLELDSDQLGLVSQTAPQTTRFGLYAEGGGSQVQFASNELRQRLDGLQVDDFGRSTAPVAGVRSFDLAGPEVLDLSAEGLATRATVLQEPDRFAETSSGGFDFELPDLADVARFDFGLW